MQHVASAARPKHLRASLVAGIAAGVCACRALVGVDDLQFTDAASSGDGAPQDSPIDGGDAMTMGCPFDPDAHPFVTPNAPSSSCSDADISNLYTACGDPLQCSPDACSAAATSTNPCFQCLVTSGGAVTFEDNVPLPNIGACVATLAGPSCGQAAFLWQECGRAACCDAIPSMDCMHPADKDYVTCVFQAMAYSAQCNSYLLSVKSCLNGLGGTIAGQVEGATGCALPFGGTSMFSEPDEYPPIATLLCRH